MIAQSSDVPSVVVWSLILIGVIIASFYAVMRLRRWLKEEDIAEGSVGFTLSDLRELHRRGDMTTEEFEKAKSQMLAAGKAATSKMPHPLARPGRGPDQR